MVLTSRAIPKLIRSQILSRHRVHSRSATTLQPTILCLQAQRFLRSNIPKISEHCFTVCDKEFPTRAKALGKSIIVGGENYGQGSSREHAALAPLFLGVKAVLVKSFARIHKSNLINAGILPLTFVNAEDYDKIKLGDMLELPNVKDEIANGKQVTVVNKTTGDTIVADCELSDRTRNIIIAGGLHDYTKENS